MDFGLAKKSGKDITGSGEILGTPRYMAPEQAQGKNKDICAATDVYALGICLYELLAGVAAVKGQKPIEVIYHILHSPIPPLQKHKPQLARELSIICAKAIAKEPLKRYQQAKDFAMDIERFLQGGIIKAQPFPWWYHLWHKIKRYKLAVTMVFIGFLLLAMALNHQENKRRERVTYYISKSQQILSGIPEKFREDLSIEKLQTIIVAGNIQKILEKYLKAIEPLNKALIENSHHTAAQKQLLQLYTNLGLLALEKKEYLLSSRAFKQCYILDKKAGEKLQNIWKEHKHKQLVHLAKIMSIVGKRQPQQQQLERWAMEISRMKETKIVKKLLPYIKSKNKWQRKLAIKALGELGNTFTKAEGKDSVEWLLEYLGKLKPLTDYEINEQNKHQILHIVEVMEALGLLKDSRSDELVLKMRGLAGYNSLLWNLTKISYSRISLPTKEINTAEDFAKRGLMKSQKGDLDGAIADFNQVISLNPKDVDAYNSRGLVWCEKGELEKAIADYNQALSLDPKLAGVYNNRGAVWKEKGELEKAIADYNQVISLNPKLAYAYNNRGLVWRKKGELEKAIADYSQALSLNPKYTLAYFNRAAIFVKKGQHKKAISDFSYYLVLFPNAPQAQQIKAYIQQHR